MPSPIGLETVSLLQLELGEKFEIPLDLNEAESFFFLVLDCCHLGLASEIFALVLCAGIAILRRKDRLEMVVFGWKFAKFGNFFGVNWGLLG